MFDNTSSGSSMFLFFIGLIIVWAILFNGGGAFGGRYGDTGAVAQDNYNNLLRATTETSANTNARVDALQTNVQNWLLNGSVAQLQGAANDTAAVLAAVNAGRKDTADIYVQTLLKENAEQSAKITSLEAQMHINDKFAIQTLENCRISNQLTQIENQMIKQPPFIAAGGTPEIACSNLPFPTRRCS